MTAPHPDLDLVAASGPQRIIFDITSTASWFGPPVGIMRVEQELARYARTERPDIILAFYRPSIGFRPVTPQFAETVIGSHAIIDPIYFFRLEHLQGIRRWLPSRYPLLIALERLRLMTKSAIVSRVADVLQRILLLNRYSHPFINARKKRVAVISPSFALGSPLSLGPRDVFVSAGDGWLKTDIEKNADYKNRLGFRWVVLCYDLIPLTHPEFYSTKDVEAFRQYWTMMFALADRIIFNSRQIESDAQFYCERAGIRMASTAVVPLGHQPRPPSSNQSVPLPPPLEPGRFALFVSTIEPRKGHGMLVRVWRRLLADGVPQRNRFNLVFVGRRGWMVDAVLREIDEMRGEEAMLQHFADLPDAGLVRLYQDAAFCLYPSIYEGFGLPIVEAFSYGKAVLASTGGALPETVAGLSPCLNPVDEDAWYSHLKGWIEDPAAHKPFEEKIRISFCPATWHDVARRFFAAAVALSPPGRNLPS